MSIGHSRIRPLLAGVRGAGIAWPGAVASPAHIVASINGAGADPIAALMARERDGTIARGERYVAAIAGTPYWADEDLSRRHADSGAAHALLAAADRFGEEAFSVTSGAFAAALWDARERRLSIAIDRAGIGDLYWTAVPGGGFAFASDCDTLASAPGFDATIDRVSLYNYLFYYCVPGPRSIYRSIRKLLPGECVSFTPEGVRTRHYWRMPYRQETGRDTAEWKDDIQRVLGAAVSRAIAGAAGEAGTFLSGGLDSSTITGLTAARQSPSKSFTVRFHEPQYDEGEFARIAAEHFATEHHERYVVPDEVVAIMDDVAAHCDEPYGNTSAIAAYYCAAAAREAGVGTLIAGDGGDELFAGNERYILVFRADLYGRIPELLRRTVFDPLLSPRVLDRLSLTYRARRLKRLYYMTLPSRMYAGYHPFQHFALDRVFCADHLAEIETHDPIDLAADAFTAAEGGDDVQRLMAVDLKLTIADNDLVKVNRMCELAGVEVRYPMLDDAVMELAARIPGSALLADGRLRGLFKDAMADFLPPEIITKSKKGFGLPFQVWASEHKPLNEKLLDTLNDMRSRGLFTHRYIDALQDACRPGKDASLRGNAWDAAMLELWFKTRRFKL